MKNILITGACGGMGMAACRKLAQAGYNIYGMDVREPAEEFPGVFVKCDITDEESIRCALAKVQRGNVILQENSMRTPEDSVEGIPDGIKFAAVIHHAGMYDLGSLVEMSDKEMLRIFNVNLFGMARLNRLILPVLEEKARIIITSSELAPLDPLPFTGIYGITKTAVEKYAFSLRMELQLLGYTVSVIRPGAVKTQLLDVSTSRLDAFCQNTNLYQCNAVRFRKIVDSVETANVSADRIAEIDLKILQANKPGYVYNINRNVLLRLLNILPARLQTMAIRIILKNPK